MRTWKITAALVLAAAAVAAGLPAQAGELGALGFGTQVPVRVTTGMYAAPGLSTPRVGTAQVGDNVAAVCRQQDSNGQLMVLGIDRTGRTGSQWSNTAGFIWPFDLDNVPTSLLTCTAFRSYPTLRDTGLYSAPGLSTPRPGTVWAGERFFAICKIPDSNGRRMVLGVAESGRAGVQFANTAGYVWDDDINKSEFGTDSLSDCGVS
ncbi:hypothetical protein [Lentzea sp. NPDC059081]|uniref:hypothetical protein n=1 Tax=Lentzea sp. NPDC059081 TaxID=3346719 RepID=UPI003697ACAC